MPRPNFLIIGTPKSGTSWLIHRIGAHPQIFAQTKELNFFHHEENFSKGMAWYEEFFEQAGPEKLAVGEKTPTYLWGERYPGGGGAAAVAQRVKQCLPDVKLIVLLRNPASRAVSHYNHLIRRGFVSPFENIDEVLTRKRMEAVKKLGLFENGYYARHLEQWLRYFPPERLRVLLFEKDVVAQPETCLAGLCEYLGVDSSFSFPELRESRNEKMSKLELIVKYYSRRLHKVLRPLMKQLPGNSYRPRPATHAFLAEHYATENERLAHLCKLDLSCWNRPKAAAA